MRDLPPAAAGSAPKEPGPGSSIREFWNARGKSTFWVTQYFGYSIGCVLGPLCRRARLTPNMVTVLGLLVAVIAVGLVGGGLLPEGWPEGLFLTVMLLVSFGLDCTDGPLARVTGNCRPFGMLWDKLVDLLSLFVIAIGLGFAARTSPPANLWLREHWELAFPALLLWSVVPKTLLSVFGWLKDLQVNGMSRTRPAPSLTQAARLKRLAGNLIDEPSFRIAAGACWGLGWYWEFVLLYHGLAALLLAGYVAATWRSMTATGA